eukprot:3083642-Alexandrium_andersonii.AAC.1
MDSNPVASTLMKRSWARCVQVRKHAHRHLHTQNMANTFTGTLTGARAFIASQPRASTQPIARNPLRAQCKPSASPVQAQCKP